MTRTTQEARVTAPAILAEKAGDLHASALFDEGTVVLTPIAEQHFLLAIATLKQAQAFFALASKFQAAKL
jgi:hypothetical protein